jgi:hypothetical protein
MTIIKRSTVALGSAWGPISGEFAQVNFYGSRRASQPRRLPSQLATKIRPCGWRLAPRSFTGVI